MTETTQEQYERRVKRYGSLLHGTDQDGLIGKLQMYQSFLKKHRDYGDRLWKIEPLLYYLIQSLEQDVHLTLAKFFDKSGYDIRTFINFCNSNRRQITWKSCEPLNEQLLKSQEIELDSHKPCIDSIVGRRNKFFAHKDKEYLDQPENVYSDYPLSEDDVVALANTLISIVNKHQVGMSGGTASFHLAEFIEIAVDNMVRNLEAGRRLNFPNQDLD